MTSPHILFTQRVVHDARSVSISSEVALSFSFPVASVRNGWQICEVGAKICGHIYNILVDDHKFGCFLCLTQSLPSEQDEAHN